MNINPLLLYVSGIVVDESLNNLSDNEERIIVVLHGVDLKDYDELLMASEELQGIDGAEVVKCVSDHWRAEEYGSEGIENLEKIFQAKVNLDKAIGIFFADNEHWDFSSSNSEWLKEFNKDLGCNMTVDDVTKNISMDYLIDSHKCGPGLNGFFEFVVDNGGDPKLFIKKVASEIERLPQIDLEDIVYWMAPYIQEGDIDVNKMFSRIDWDVVKEDEDDLRQFKEFFDRLAPELSSQIPA